MNTIDAMKQALDQLESDWCQIDQEWGPTKGGLEGAIARGEETEIPMLREAISREEAQTVEPVIYQYRARTLFGIDKGGWHAWTECSKEQAEEFGRNPVLYDWEYEARALFTRPSPPSSGERSDLIAKSQEHAESLRVVMQDQAAETIDSLCEMLAADAKEIERLRSVVAVNHEWHMTHDDFDGYVESELHTVNTTNNTPTVAQQVAVPQGWKLVDVDQLCEIVRDIHQHVQQGHLSEVHVAKQSPGYGTGIYTHIWHQMNKLSAALSAAPQPPQAERVPMTEAEIVKQRGPIHYTTEAERRVILATYTSGIRGAEAHHGIRL